MSDKITKSEQKNIKLKKTSTAVKGELTIAEPVASEKVVRIIGGIDKPFMILVLILVGFGVIAVASASYSYAEMTQGDAYYFTKKHVFYVALGLGIMFLLSNVDYRFCKKFSVPIWIISLLMCLAVWTPLGHSSGGARRWINLGFITFQPSEVLKFGVIVVCASFAANAKEKIKGIKCLLFYILVVGLSAGVLVVQPHLSCTIIVCLLVFCMMIMGGVRWVYTLSGAGVIGVAGFTFIKMFSHASARLAVWYNPFDPLYFKNDGWQPAQSLFAIASGGLWGVGLGQSNQKDGYIPEPQNDYIFSVICEELGFFGAVAIMALFAALIWRGMYIAKKAPTVFSGLLVAGVISQIGIQTLLNIAVVTNTLPSTGISLPFLSSGGTSLVILLAQIGIVLSVSRQTIVEQG